MRFYKKKLWEQIIFSTLFILFICIPFSCQVEYPEVSEGVRMPTKAVLVLSEGNFQGANASLEVYDPSGSEEVITHAFRKANGIPLGDVAQSITIRGDEAWICVNTSKVIFHIDLSTLKLKGLVKNIPKPRYMHFVNDTKAYVTHLEYPHISIINPKNYQKIGEVKTFMSSDKYAGNALSQSTEEMVAVGKYLFVSCWSYQRTVLVVDMEQDKVVKEIEVGYQPSSMSQDKDGKLWVLCGGAYYKNDGLPSLYRIDTETFEATKVAEIQNLSGDAFHNASNLVMVPDGSSFYFLSVNHIYKMGIYDTVAPSKPAIELPPGNHAYALAIAPESGDIYVADAIDYSQRGVVYRYSADLGEPKDSYRVGIIPGSFAFYSK